MPTSRTSAIASRCQVTASWKWPCAAAMSPSALSVKPMPQLSPVARNPSSASRSSARAMSGLCPKLCRSCAMIILATARSHGSGSAKSGSIRSKLRSRPSSWKIADSGGNSRSTGCLGRMAG